MSDKRRKAISKMIKTQTKVNLSFYNVPASFMMQLYYMWNKISQIIELDLTFNDIGNEGVIWLCKTLQLNNCYITNLYLTHCHITNEGLINLANVIRSNQCKLTELVLSHNSMINHIVMKYLFKAMKLNKSITRLHLNYLNIGLEGIPYLSTFVKNNNTIKHLELFGALNNLALLSQALKFNNSINILNISNNDDADLHCLIPAMKINIGITDLMGVLYRDIFILDINKYIHKRGHGIDIINNFKRLLNVLNNKFINNHLYKNLLKNVILNTIIGEKTYDIYNNKIKDNMLFLLRNL